MKEKQDMFKIAIVGASGLVGKKIIEVLMEQNLLENAELKLFVSGKKDYETILVKGKIFSICVLTDETKNKKFDIVFFSAGDEVSAAWAEIFAKNGAFVIDNSNAFRRRRDIPLIVPEINSHLITAKNKIISNPNCSTIELAVVVERLLNLGEISQIIVSTYQSISGAGSEALSGFLQKKQETKFGIRDNIIAQIGEILENGYSLEEDKIMFELNKITGSNCKVSATAVRVPIPYCHGESVFVRFKNKIKLDEVKRLFNQNYLKFHETEICYPVVIANTDITHVFRLREVSENEITFFIIADNLRRGAAYNAVMIAKYILKKFF